MSSQAMSSNVPATPLQAQSSPGYWLTVLRRLGRDPVTVGAAMVILLLLLLALLGSHITPADPYASSILKRLKPIGFAGHPLGTDELGRDMLTRLMVGSRLSLFMGITPVLLAFSIGSFLGILAGYRGGLLNTLIMRTIDVFYAFPSVLLAIALSGALGAGITNSLISLTIVFIPPIARVAESVTTQIRNREFVDAARASGASGFRIVRVHVLGNVLSPIFVYATSLIAVSMILASGLSFLGLGVKPPEPEWGLMLNTLRTAIYVQPWVAALPGVMIFITSIAFNLFSDGLRNAMEIRS
ncbi:MAG: ABC transporter permease [Betaproteobacteria bacterium]|jgi:peptide/nickel transport system permease protein|nr:ABC transporter permease [Betaproteobacteria bacterium]